MTEVVEFNGQKYAIFILSHTIRKNKKKTVIPIVIDYEDTGLVNPKEWNYTANGYVSRMTKDAEGVRYQEYLHSYLYNIDNPDADQSLSITHLNGVNTDNRKANLRQITEEITPKNKRPRKISKNKRDILLKGGIEIDELPSFTEFEERGSGRFKVKIDRKQLFVSTGSKDFSLRFKLEQTKQFMRDNQEHFQGRCINGELDYQSQELYKEYIEIIKIGGFIDMINIDENKLNPSILSRKYDTLTVNEIDILEQNPFAIPENVVPNGYSCELKTQNKRGYSSYIVKNSDNKTVFTSKPISIKGDINGKDYPRYKKDRIKQLDEMVKFLSSV